MRSGTDIRLASDRTYLRRYNFIAPTWLTSNIFAERFTTNSYFSANAYYFQRQRIAPTSGSVPGVARWKKIRRCDSGTISAAASGGPSSSR